ncbi:MAG: hypothetical protein ATN31_02875 [Candidatus Epulonipiscioides saccharophilum]|nr:MAG: hypothetical protein ATN31_02875 [Epulopiscium sp. AS2M-Bin001]
MKKLFITLIILCCTISTLIRITDEYQNKAIEIAVRYEDLLLISKQQDIAISKVIDEFKNLGITTIAAKPQDLDKNFTNLNIIPIINNESFEYRDNFSHVFFENTIKNDWAMHYGVCLVEFFTQIPYPANFKYARLFTDATVKNISTPNRVNRYKLALEERTNRIFIFTLDQSGVDSLKTDIKLFINDVTNNGFYLSSHGLHSIRATLIRSNLIISFLQGIALLLAIIWPVLVIYKIAFGNIKNSYAIIYFLKICSTTTLGAIAISCILNFANFRLGINSFRGVKVAYILPIFLIAIIALYRSVKTNSYIQNIKQTLTLYIFINYFKKNWLLLISLTLIAGIILYLFIIRTGNSQITLLEQNIRQYLDLLFGIRPRTKEILIGHPALICGLYYKKAKYLGLVIGTIGQVSIINTFMHLHTPFIVSLHRTIIGIFFGGLLGIILILIFRVMNQWIKKHE